MSDFLNSPVWATILAIVGSGVGALIAMAAKLHTKMNGLTDAVKVIQEDITDIKNDKNIMRWSDLGSIRFRRRKNVL